VTEQLRTADEPIPFETLWQGTDQLELDQQAQLSPGANGILRREYRIRLEDGLQVSEALEREWVQTPAAPQIMGYGTRVVIRVLETTEGAFEYWRVVRMRATAYTAASAGKPPDHPAYGITASGVQAGNGVVAVDPSVVPFRSWVYVPGYGIGYAGDTGGGVRGRWIDLGYDEGSLTAWNTHVDVYYLTPAPAADQIAYRLPTALP
jgi:3D (Asp-Asp-Asp) domain-containing protein